MPRKAQICVKRDNSNLVCGQRLNQQLGKQSAQWSWHDKTQHFYVHTQCSVWLGSNHWLLYLAQRQYFSEVYGRSFPQMYTTDIGTLKKNRNFNEAFTSTSNTCTIFKTPDSVNEEIFYKHLLYSLHWTSTQWLSPESLTSNQLGDESF